MNNKFEVDSLCYDLVTWLNKKKSIIFKLNNECTQDTEYSIKIDFQFINQYLLSYSKNNSHFFNSQLKPKGKVILVLSFNEPLVTAIVPVLNALVAGNEVVVRPSRRGTRIFDYIWKESGVCQKYGGNLKTMSGGGPEVLEKELMCAQALYFFGGHKNAKTVFLLCSKNFVEFYPEIEAADFKVVKISNLSNFDMDQDIETSLTEAFTHTGQSCQRIQGIFVHDSNHEEYSKRILKRFNQLVLSKRIERYISPNFNFDETMVQQLNVDMSKAAPTKLIRANNKFGFPVLVLNPNPKSVFVQSAYFLPVIWVTRYSTEEELFDNISSRPYHLGVNIQSDEDKFIQKLIRKTNFTRYTVNTDHSRVRPNEGWGGSWPTGYSGNKSWLELFSYPYQIVTQ
ncbi:MAG: hypothetical protein A2700_03075 [Candidatus Blackburnbacteria bacterium RIFCSPHIGHO2_01_FULL_44_64]|uniref:Aldehyde dehydrogenase domain-containing protein n=2 Tax=Patescibacteria group TaxID=1783273 RepID=A0A0G1KF28_9BACT|nr:MAG: hypothetical protein UW78_C0002G0014 [Candidatus Azambacteria bacterium GW2011_GWA1_44_9]OGY08317.1 MAG: hypothetical protein A2700_03075 [Candidatus Blackburnbacteria bacterium RIFCSPHIGHO2_01_FULL_44_64]OGY10372.1 MAG: hypothetical protein A3D26_03620 [Candidatus Blackburnbacteria bacterium RIFCSPHIGHO2_02_FULL_44_20]OGY12117.1 MAG: hypothetical protein A3E16_00160 [Candidatus Blackburnbacteria bacterium RIFCSPHIGHO2_12_FULL_44_25]OGY13734.1 MAG: hypothetical protein A3A62_02885 [Cand